MLQIQRLSKSYGKQNVLQNFNLDIESGEIISVVGSSGSGKTTLLRLISGLESPDSCLLYTSPSPRDGLLSRMPSSA